MANSNRVHQIANMHNDKTREQYEITDTDARERLDAVEANMTSALAQISAAEGRINSAVQTQNGQIGALDGRTEALEDGVEAINEALQENVTSVNGQIGNVVLTATDVGALPDDTLIPQYLSELHPDEDHQTVTAAEKTEWYDKIGRDEYSYLYNRVERVVGQSGEPNVIDTILVNGVEVVPDERVVDIPDTTYSIGVSGHTLTLTDSDGHSQTASLPNDSYDDATLAGRVTDAERDIGSLQSAIENIELTAEAVSYGNNSNVKAALDSMAQTEASLSQTAQAIPGMQTLLNATVANQTAEILTSTTATKAYAIGDYLVLNGVLRKVTSSISTGDTISDSNTTTETVTGILNDKAPKSHASTATTYGIGNATNYGHVILSDAYGDAETNNAAANGMAASQKAVNDAYTALSGKISDGLTFGKSGSSYGYWVNGANFKSFRQPTGNAVAGDVLSGKTFANAASDSETGTMPNNGAVSQALNCGASYTVPAGYHNGSGTVTANSLASQTGVDDGKTAATAASMRSGYQAWVNGSKVSGSMATLTSSNFSGTHSSTTAGASSNYVTKSTSAGYVANNTSVNTLAAATSATIATTGATGTKTINIKPGYYNKISVNQTAAYEAGESAGRTTGLSLTKGASAAISQHQTDKAITVQSNCLIFFWWDYSGQGINYNALYYKHGTTLTKIWSTGYGTSDDAHYLTVTYVSNTSIKVTTKANSPSYIIIKLA